MAERIPQSVSYLVVFRAYLASDGKTPATGKTIAITISKNGATSFSNPAAGATNATEMASGFYKFTLGTGDTDTLGPLAWRGAEGTINDAGDVLTVAKATNAGFSALPDAAAGASGGLPLSVDSSGRVDVLKINGTSQTARDIGASVLLSSGTGTGQLDFTSGIVKSNLTQILGTVLTETAGQIAAAFKKFFNIATPAATMDHLILVDTVTTVTGLTASDVGAIKAKTDNLPSDPADESLIIAATDAISAAIAALNNLSVNDVWDEVIDGLLTARQSLRLQNSAAGGKLSGAATTNVLVRDIADTKNRIDATVDADGNRSAVTLDVS